MRKLIFTLTFAFVAMMSQAQVFEQGTNMINVGIGFGSNLGSGGLGGGARPAISASYERGVWEVGGPGVISLGGYIGNTGYSSGGFKMDYTIIGFRSAYHYNGFTEAPDLDVYAGAMLAYNVVSSSLGSWGAVSGNNIGLSAFIGGRYMFSDKFGVFGELGYGVSTLNVGLAYKF